MQVAILGASGIGKYHAKDFAAANCDVVAILGRSMESASRTALTLKEKFGLTVTPYDDIDKLLAAEKIDIASVCVPSPIHESFIEKCLESKVHVFCEKPMLDGINLYNRASKLFNQAKQIGVLLNVNMQWAYLPFVIPHDEVMSSFEVSMEPGVKGVNMLVDQLCHATSVLQKLVPDGMVKNVHIDQRSANRNEISFKYVSDKSSCDVRYKFTYKKDQPRAITFSINGKDYNRKIGKNYQQSFVHGDTEYMLEDPFTVSITRFVSAVKGKGLPLLNEKEILHNLQVQEDILKAYV